MIGPSHTVTSPRARTSLCLHVRTLPSFAQQSPSGLITTRAVLTSSRTLVHSTDTSVFAGVTTAPPRSTMYAEYTPQPADDNGPSAQKEARPRTSGA